MIPFVTRQLHFRRISRLKLQNNATCRNYSGNIENINTQKSQNLCPPPKKRSPVKKGAAYTLAAVCLVGGGTLAYMKYDNDFRKKVVKGSPLFGEFLKMIYLEEDFGRQVGMLYGLAKESLLSKVDRNSGPDKRKNKDKTLEPIKDYAAPAPIIKALPEVKPEEEKFLEIRKEAISPDGLCVETVEVAGVVKTKNEDLPLTHTKNLIVLEEEVCSSAEDAINAYKSAMCDVQKFNQEIEIIVDRSIDKVPIESWDSIKIKSKIKDDSIKRAQRKSEHARKQIKKLQDLIVQPDFKAEDDSKDVLLSSLKKLEDDIHKSKKELEDEIQVSSVTYKYWERVKDARKHFSKELEALFPTINLNKRTIKLSSKDLDLFLTHAFSHVLFYQKELAKAETVAQERLAKAIEVAKQGGGVALTEAQICEALEQEKRVLTLNFKRECLKLRQESEAYLREQLKHQSQAFSDHLEEAIRQKEREVDRGLARKFDEKLEAERCKFKMQLAAIIGRLRGLDRTLKMKELADEEARKSQILWSACQALLRALKSSCPGLPWQTQLRPLTPEIRAVQMSAAQGDELVEVVLKGIPSEAKERGIFPEDALRERFFKVEKVARTMALVSEKGSALPIYFLSYIQSLFLINAPSPIPQAELNDEETDFSKMNTIEILQRARYWMDRGNITQCLRYMNLLKGASRSVAKQWMKEARLLIETQQAANTLMAHAVSSGLVYL